MAHIAEWRVRETTLTEGTADLVLAGAMRGSLPFQSAAVMAVGDTCDYAVHYDTVFEAGLGTLGAGGELQRTTVYRARHANGDINTTKLSLPPGVKTVIMSVRANKVVRADITQPFTQAERDKANANLGNFPSGTKLIFPQASAPPGWTRDVIHNDKILRIVSGNGGGSGGSAPFSTVFGANATSGTSITQANLPSGALAGSSAVFTNNDLAVTAGSGTVATDVSTGITFYQSAAYRTVSSASTINQINLGGSGTAHTHPIELRVQYVDCNICTKD